MDVLTFERCVRREQAGLAEVEALKFERAEKENGIDG
jgi:hypothetical protein